MKVQIGNQTIEVPQGVDVRIIEDEPVYKFKPGQTIHYEGGVYEITSLTQRGYKVKEIASTDPEWETTEIGFSQEDKMSEAPRREFRVGDFVWYKNGVYKITGILDGSYCVEEIQKGFADGILTAIGKNAEGIVLYQDAVYDPIMDLTQNHDPRLVVKINEAWRTDKHLFFPIMIALYYRDADEIRISEAFDFDYDMDCQDIYEAMVKEWDFHAHNYLMHIADNMDLRAILHFLHYNVPE